MKVEYNNLYTHFVFTTVNRLPIILEQFRDRIEKYITGKVHIFLTVSAVMIAAMGCGGGKSLRDWTTGTMSDFRRLKPSVNKVSSLRDYHTDYKIIEN